MFIIRQQQLDLLDEEVINKFLLELFAQEELEVLAIAPHKKRIIKILKGLKIDSIPLAMEICHLVLTYYEFGIEAIITMQQERLKRYSLPNLIESVRLILNEIAFKKYSV